MAAMKGVFLTIVLLLFGSWLLDAIQSVVLRLTARCSTRAGSRAVKDCFDIQLLSGTVGVVLVVLA